MTIYNLSLSNVVNVSVLPSPTGLGLPNVNTVALFTSETPVGSIGDYALYKSPGDVLTDWGAGSEVYAQAVALFAQNPNILATDGYLVVIPLLSNVDTKATLTIQDLTYTAKTAGVGGNDITIEYTDGATQGSEVVTVDTKAISIKIESGVSTAEDIKVAVDDYPAAAALVSVAIAAGKEITAQTDSISPTHLADGETGVNESISSAIARTIDEIYYFGVLVAQDITGTPFITLTTAMQTYDKLLFYGSATAADLEPSSGRFDVVRTSSKTHTRCIYYSISALDARIMAAAYAGRALSTNFAGINTCQTMHLKTLATIDVDSSITQTILNKSIAAGVDVYCMIAGLPVLMTSGGNTFFDEIYNEIWFKLSLQVTLFNFLYQTSGKIPQTEQGMDGLKNAARQTCEQAVKNGFVAPGSWTSSDTFGSQESLVRNIKDIGYYIYSQPIADQLQADRDARKSPLLQVALKSAGAIHKADIVVLVNK